MKFKLSAIRDKGPPLVLYLSHNHKYFLMTRRLIFIISFSIISDFAFAQKKTTQIEINPFVRIDKYPQFLYVLSGRPSTDYVNIKGTSFGLNLAYKIPITRSVLLKPGIGYYKYSFNDIKKVNTLFGKSNAKDIGFVSPLYIPFFTDKYRYNCIAANLGIEKLVIWKNDFQLYAGINLNNYYTYLQYYHITYKNPDNPINNDYKLKNGRYFGFSANLNASLLKEFGKFNLGPTIILPVFDIWKTDKTFPEETNSGTRRKWLNGIGLGISFNYLLTKK